MKTEVFLVRHGETNWNADGRFQGCTDIDLSETGIIQAHFLKERFNGEFDCIYTSPLKRAVKTAKIISESTKIVPSISKEIREINFGEWEGLTINQIKSQYNKEFNIWRNDDMNGNMVGGDLSLRNAGIRANSEIKRIVSENLGRRIIIVAHGGIIKAGLIGIFDWKMTMYHRLILGNTSVTKLNFDDDLKSMLIFLNDTSHLPTGYKSKFYA